MNEIVLNRSKEELRQIEENKHSQLRGMLDQTMNDKEQEKEKLFFGMSDKEILVNKKEFMELGLI